MKNLLVAQSGGPSAAINATLAGICERALTSGNIDTVYGARYGIKGVLEDNIINIGEKLSDPAAIKRLVHTPASALGSCRIKLGTPETAEHDYKTIFETFERHNIGWFIYIGGNDSMDTVEKLSKYAKAHNINVGIMGAPKTIDNDLCVMDHSPGFGSAAKYIATTFSELWCDCRVYDIPAVTIVEVMGRHVGWLTAASSLACVNGEAPHLIYLPEVAFDDDKFIEDVKEKLAESPAVLIAVSEGIQYGDGRFVGESSQSGAVDVFGHKYLSGAAKVLEGMIKEKVGCKVRSIDLSLMQRCAGHIASSNDLVESKLLGATALDRALNGVSGEVSILRRISDSPYKVKYDSVLVSEVANREKAVPREWINERGNYVTLEMLKYLSPLIDGGHGTEMKRGLPKHFEF